MRILMLNNEFPPLGGGTGTVNRAMLHQFSRMNDLEIDLVTSALGNRFEQELFASTIKIYKVPVRNKNIHHSSNRELSEYFFRGLWLALKLQRTRSYELCFAWSTVPAGAIALVLRRLVGIRYIVRVCGPDIPGFERRYDAIHKLLAPLIWRIWRRAEKIVAKSSHEIEMIHTMDSNLPCLLIPNGVDIAAFRRNESMSEAGPLHILCVGRLIERKGQQHLIAAVKKLMDEGIDVRLDLVGTGDARLDNEAQVARFGLADRVRFLGYVPREKIAECYAAAHVFALASYNEGMSVALLEAMASGLAVIVTSTGGTAELVQPDVNGFIFEWGDVASLTAYLRRLSEDRSLVRRMGDASRSRVMSFSWELPALAYIDLLRQLTAIMPSMPYAQHGSQA